jgi:GNAT superfamily N-acetyltransferase
MDRRRHAARLQGRLRNGGDGRLPVRLRGHHGRRARSSFRVDGSLLGGLYGWGQLGWFFVKLLALAPGARGRGIGGQLLGEAETHARRSGLVGIYLDTYEFQAPEFYAKMGYTEFGRLPAAGGHPQRIWYAKTLDETETER